MLIDIFNQYSNKFYNFCNNLKVYRLVITTTLLTVIFYFPDINQYRDYGKLYNSIDKEINYPFHNDSYTDESVPEFNMHTEKRKFRLLVPLTAKLLHFDSRKMIWLQVLLLPVFILIMYNVFLKITEDKISSVIFTLALPFIYVTESFLWMLPIYDSFGYLLLALLFLVNNNTLRYFILLLICISDERAIISSFIVYLSIYIHKYKTLNIIDLHKPNPLTLIFYFGWMTCFVIRLSLMVFKGISIPISSEHGNGLFVFVKNYSVAPIGIFLAYEGFWFVLLPAIMILVLKENKFEIFIITFSALLFFTINLMVFDITRSFGYSYTFIFTALLLILRSETISTIRNISIFTLIGSILTPTMLVYSHNGKISISWLSPIFPKILTFF